MCWFKNCKVYRKYLYRFVCNQMSHSWFNRRLWHLRYNTSFTTLTIVFYLIKHPWSITSCTNVCKSTFNSLMSKFIMTVVYFYKRNFLISIHNLLTLALLTVNLPMSTRPTVKLHTKKGYGMTYRKDTNDVTTGDFSREISLIDISRGFKQVCLLDDFAQTA